MADFEEERQVDPIEGFADVNSDSSRSTGRLRLLQTVGNRCYKRQEGRDLRALAAKSMLMISGRKMFI